MLKYFLAPESYVCVADRQAVFLDLKRDKYSALSAEDAQMLASFVNGWPMPRTGEGSLADDSAGVDLAEELVKEGLLTRDGTLGRPASPVVLEPATQALASTLGLFPEFTSKELRSFMLAWGRTTAMLRCLPLQATVERIRRRKARARSNAFEPQAVRRLAIAYSTLQPNFFSAVDNCLRNSLTFTEYLASYGFHPTWVFGVRMNPFQAHSWVQEGSVVLNDQVACVRAFTPIMTV